MATLQLDLPLSSLFMSTLNTRTDLQAGQEDSGIDELAESIREKGLLQPITVRPSPDGRYEVIVGQRRLRACHKAGLDPVPCLVRDDLSDTDAVAISLVENVHRADMNPLDKARALKALYDRYGTYDRVARETSWSVQTVRRYMSLLDLPDQIQRTISTAEGPARVGALSRLASTFKGEQAVEVFQKIGSFKQNIQEEILKRSEGDIATVDGLVSDAMQGAFRVRMCGGRFRCEIVRDILEGEISKGEFEDLVNEVATNTEVDLEKTALARAAREFWRSLSSR